jgi:predicted DNA-binding transcriptional regulator AlpA
MNGKENEPLFMGTVEACKRYGISKRTLYNLFREEGCPPVMKLGAKTMLEVAAFDAFIRSLLTPSVVEQNKTA